MARRLHRSKQMTQKDDRRVLLRLASGMTVIVGTVSDMQDELRQSALPAQLTGVVVEGNTLIPSTGIDVTLAHMDDRYVLYREVA